MSLAAYAGRGVSHRVFAAVALPVAHTQRSHCVRENTRSLLGFDASHARALSRAPSCCVLRFQGGMFRARREFQGLCWDPHSIISRAPFASCIIGDEAVAGVSEAERLRYC